MDDLRPGLFGVLLALLLPAVVLSTSKNPMESSLRQDVLANYDKLTRPDHQVNLEVGQYVLNLQMNLIMQELAVKGWITLSWNDERLVWNATQWNGIQEIRVPISEIWAPDVAIFTSVRRMDVYQSTAALAIVYPTGKVLFVPAVTHVSLCQANFTDYPYGVQNCTIKMGSWTTDKSLIDINPMTDSPPMDFEHVPTNMLDILSYGMKGEEKTYPGLPTIYKNVAMNIVFKYKKPKGIGNAAAVEKFDTDFHAKQVGHMGPEYQFVF